MKQTILTIIFLLITTFSFGQTNYFTQSGTDTLRIEKFSISDAMFYDKTADRWYNEIESTKTLNKNNAADTIIILKYNKENNSLTVTTKFAYCEYSLDSDTHVYDNVKIVNHFDGGYMFIDADNNPIFAYNYKTNNFIMNKERTTKMVRIYRIRNNK